MYQVGAVLLCNLDDFISSEVGSDRCKLTLGSDLISLVGFLAML